MDGCKVNVRLYWHDGKVEDVRDVPDGTTAIMRKTTENHRHFHYTGDEDDDGFARFIEDEGPDE